MSQLNMQINFEPCTKMSLQNEQRATTGLWGGTFSHGPQHCYVHWTHLMCCFKLQNKLSFRLCFSFTLGLAGQQLGGISVKLHLLLLPLMEELVQTNTTWLLQSQILWFLHTWCLILTFRKAAKAGPKLVCVLVRSLIHAGSLASVVGRAYRRSHSTMEE